MTYVYGRTWSYSKWMDACCHGSSIGKCVLEAVDIECIIQWPYKIELKQSAVDILLNSATLNWCDITENSNIAVWRLRIGARHGIQIYVYRVHLNTEILQNRISSAGLACNLQSLESNLRKGFCQIQAQHCLPFQSSSLPAKFCPWQASQFHSQRIWPLLNLHKVIKENG